MKSNGMERVPMVTQFYVHPEGELFAYFPHTDERGGYKLSYAHIGQHSACHPNYVAECSLATEEEYKPLFDELVSIGYDVLIPNRSVRVDVLLDMLLNIYFKLSKGEIAPELWSDRLAKMQGYMSDNIERVEIGFLRNFPDGDFSENLLEQRYSIGEKEAIAILTTTLFEAINCFSQIPEK